jgi:cyclic-di-AMP phosphodiesterase PgpH
MTNHIRGKGRILPIVYAIVIYVFCVALSIYMFPEQSRFNYNYNIGSPWMHADLIADFDFPIYKSDEEIQNEKDIIIDNFVPYCYFNKDNDSFVYTFFNNEIDKIISEIQDEYKGVLFKRHKIRLINTSLDNIKEQVSNKLREAYSIGVYEESVFISKEDLYIIDNENIEKHNLNEFISTQYLSEDLKNIVKKYDSYDSDSIYLREYFNDFLKAENLIPNLVVDSELGEQILSNDLNSVSSTMGMVQAGELIILRGNIVDDYTYQILNSLRKHYDDEESEISFFPVLSGLAVLMLIVFLSIILYMYRHHKSWLYSYKANSYIALQIAFVLISSLVILKYTGLSINYIPFPLIALLILTFYNFHLAFFVYFSALLMTAIFIPNGFEFVFIQLSAGGVALFSMKKVQKRSQIFICMLLVMLSYILVKTGFILIKTGDFSAINHTDYYPFAISSFLLLLYLPFVFIYEKAFSYVSHFSLMELSDTNNQLLRQLAEKAPGTFQHTLQVANLTESVVRELDGDALLARTGALYHDIGKSVDSQFFIENQSGGNIHDNLGYEESAQKIINHVVLGIKLAKKHKLPAKVSDFITMHHGTGVTKYFYNSWINENPNKEAKTEKFTYPGPRPQTLETAVMMMADAIEAAARTLNDYTDENIVNLVNKIIDSQLEEGQFADVDITLKQISIAKKTFVEKIKNIYHSRISYPGINKK